MRLRDTVLTGASSYVQMGSQVLVGLITIPLALHFLDNEEFGLWSFVAQSVGYLMLLDIGIGHSLGRLLAEPLHNGSEEEWNGWFNLALVVFVIQAMLILGLGVFLVNPILDWFPIPPRLFHQARELWLMILVLNASVLPLRVFRGIVIAQNRSYWMFGGAALGSWCGLLAFYLFLRAGWGVLAYGWSAIVQTSLILGLPLVATVFGPHRFRLSWRNIPWRHLRELFGFSSAMFVISISVQIAFMSQTMIITKVLGLAAVASFTVCTRVPMLLMQFVWQPYDACMPRWQIFWARGQKDNLREEYRRMLRFTVGLASLVMLCAFALNRWFVFIFARPDLYAGKTFDFFFVLYVMAPVWTHCLSTCFVLSKRMKGLAFAVLIGTLLFVTAAVAGTRMYGLTGYAMFTACYSLTSVGLWYQTTKGPKLLGLRTMDLVRDQRKSLLVCLMLLGAGWLGFRVATTFAESVIAEVALVVVAVAWFTVNFRQDLVAFLRLAQRAQERRASQEPGLSPTH